MTTPQEALADLVTALKTVDDLWAASADRLGKAKLPCVLVGAPTFRGETYDEPATEAEFPVTLLVRLDDRAIERLLHFYQACSTAIEQETPAVVTGAVPLSYDLGGQPPVSAAAYELTVLYPL